MATLSSLERIRGTAKNVEQSKRQSKHCLPNQLPMHDVITY